MSDTTKIVKPPEASSTVKDESDPIENFEPLSKRRFGIPCEEGDHTLTLFIGPTRGGKSHQMKKMLMDVWIAPIGKMPFDEIYYIGQEKSFNEMRAAFATMEFVYTGNRGPYKTDVQMFTCMQSSNAINKILASDKKKRKFAIFDDCYSINGTNKTREKMVNLFQQGQHHSLTSWVVVHQSTQKEGAPIRKPANYLVFCNEPAQTVGLLCQLAPDSEVLNQYEISGQTQDGHRFIIFDQSNYAFYDYNYLKI